MINISLNQGKQFKNYQTKMKTGIANIKTVERSKRVREGFSNQGQTNALQTNASQTNALQTNALQTNASQTNALQTNALQTNASQTNALQTNASQTNALQTNALQTNASQTNASQTQGQTQGQTTDNLIQQRDERSKTISKANQEDMDRLTNLQTQYTDLQTQYNNTQKKINDNSLVSINRSSVNNPYLNKNIGLNKGSTSLPIANTGAHGGYVTSQGIFKSYTNASIFKETAGKNGCPKEITRNIGVNDYSSSLLSGQPMITGQACGNEGKNIYVSKLVTTPSSSYVGCYNDKPGATSVNACPIMNSSNSVNEFVSSASSVYKNNNTSYGPWAAFDQNPNTFWCAETDSSALYNVATGVYEGTHSIEINTVNSGKLTIKGEYLQINMPGVNTSDVQNIKVIQYVIAPRLDNKLYLTRSPNTWYLIGYKDQQWYEVDRQVDQAFSNAPKTFDVANTGDYSAYIIIVDIVGNSDQPNNRNSVQIAELNLFVSSDDTITDADRSMIYNSSSIGYTSYSDCEKYAIDNNYQYFGLQDLQSDGTAKCLVSNDYDRTIGYGDALNQVTSFPLWASNTQSGGQPYLMQVTGTGQIIVYDVNNNNSGVFTSNEGVANCVNWGTITVDTATYGGNCSSSSIGNVTDKVAGGDLNCNNKDSCSIPISNGTFGDPAPGCAKAFDIAYKCGGNPYSRNLNPAEGQTMILDCNEYMQTTCQFVMILQDDGALCLYKGSDPDTKTDLIWSSGTKGLQKAANPEWVASKGKYGRNYMKTSETLAADEWIASNDGSIKLIMQTDGNLVLYTSDTKQGCSVKDDKTYGSSWINAVYKIDPTGNRSSLGKVAYIDSDSNLKEYPTSLLSYSNQYELLNNFDSAGNDIQQIETSNKEQGCIDACNANGECAGFVYQPSGNLCYLKTSAMYPSGEKQFYSNSGIIMGVRKPQIGSSIHKSCSRDIVDVDSIQYDKYIKGEPMSSETTCGSSVVLEEDKSFLANLQNSMLSVGQEIANQTNKLYTKNNDIKNTIAQNSVQFNKNVDMYKANDNKIKGDLNLPGKFQTNTNSNTNKREGMRTIDTSADSDKTLTMNDINSMLSDTDIRVLQENYSYIFWSILAVGLLTITVNQIKK